jgi:hypothetical protein
MHIKYWRRPLGRRRHRWEGNIRMGLREIEWEFVEWMHLAQDRDQWRAVVNTAMNIRAASPGLLDCDAVQCCDRIPKFRRSMLSPSSGKPPKLWYPTITLRAVIAQSV